MFFKQFLGIVFKTKKPYFPLYFKFKGFPYMKIFGWNFSHFDRFDASFWTNFGDKKSFSGLSEELFWSSFLLGAVQILRNQKLASFFNPHSR